MLLRAGFPPDKHLEHLEHVQKKRGADSVKLGAVSGQLYKAIFKSRAFDQYFFQIPPKKRWVDRSLAKRQSTTVVAGTGKLVAERSSKFCE